jgi:alkylation response protein AidB-like acyl-CoA dehydrogenase
VLSGIASVGGSAWLGAEVGRQAGGRLEFSLSAEQHELKEAAAVFARANLDHDLTNHEEAGEFPVAAWQAYAKFGIQALPVPAEPGGGGSDVLTTALVMEGLGYGCHDNGLIFSLNAQKESGIERDLRDAVAGTIHSGTSEIQRVILSRMLGL